MVSASLILLIIRCVALFDCSSCLYEQSNEGSLVVPEILFYKFSQMPHLPAGRQGFSQIFSVHIREIFESQICCRRNMSHSLANYSSYFAPGHKDAKQIKDFFVHLCALEPLWQEVNEAPFPLHRRPHLRQSCAPRKRRWTCIAWKEYERKASAFFKGI